MLGEKPVAFVSFEAGEDLSAKQYRFVTLSSGKAIMPTAITDKCIGILQNNPVEGETALIMVYGVSKVSADAGITALDNVGTSTDGQGQKAVSTNLVFARALETASGANEIISVLLTPSGYPIP